MTAPATAARRARTVALIGRAAAAAGAAVRSLPGLAGAVAVTVGVWQVAEPAGWVVAGAFLLLTDRRVP